MSDDQITLPDDEPERPAEAGEAAQEETQPEIPREPEVPTCSECGNPLEEDQPYCLVCGAPTPNAPKLRRGVGAAGILALGLLALGVGAGALAYAIANEDDTTVATGTTPSVPTATTLPSVPSVPTFETNPPTVDQTDTFPTFPPTGPTTDFTQTFPPTLSTETAPPITETEPPTTETEPPTTETTPPSGDGDTWPDGVSGWTVILASVRSQSDAAAFRDRVQSSGRSAGLLNSSLYSSLQPGFWAVFSGQYTDRAQALNQAEILRRTYPGAYAQRIEPA